VTSKPEPPPQTGIDCSALTAAAHHEQLRRDECIGYHALYAQDGEIPGKLSIDGEYNRQLWISMDFVDGHADFRNRYRAMAKCTSESD
jgi:hypothetical protein